MATEIKIQLATYLKDAGIKATSTQIDKLAQKVGRLNSQTATSTGNVEHALGRLPGAFGRIQKAATGAFGGALAVVGAFKLGCDIGNFIFEKVITPLFGIKDPIEELKRENKRLEEQANAAFSAWENTFEAWQRGWEKEVTGAEQARQKIEDLTQAYLKMRAARERVESAKDNGALLALERDRFNAMANAASPEDAAATSKYYDVLRAEMEAKQQMAKFDREAETATNKQLAAEAELAKATDKRVRLRQQLAEVGKKIAAMDNNRAADKYGLDNSEKGYQKLLAEQKRIQSQWQSADRDVRRREAERDAAVVAQSALEIERKNLAERTSLEIDEKKKAYDDYITYVAAQDAQLAQEEQTRIKKEADAELRERQRVESQLAAERIDDLRRELSVRESAERDAQARQQAAGSSLAAAWGWYRNQGQMQSVIDEHKAQALAEAQWAKDFERLKSFRKDWRTVEFGKLSAADESVRQVALAKEEKEAADRAAIETAENTRELAEKLDELLMIKEG